MMLIELLLLALGVVIGYNIRYERRLHAENLVLDQVDARVRRELAIARNLNDSLQKDVAELKAQLSARGAPAQRGAVRPGMGLDAPTHRISL